MGIKVRSKPMKDGRRSLYLEFYFKGKRDFEFLQLYLLAKDKELGDLLRLVHESLNWILIGVVAGHAGAALMHHFVDRDDVLTRMLPFHRVHRLKEPS